MGYEIDFLPVGDKKSGDAIVLRFGNLNGRRDEQTIVVIDAGFSASGQVVVDHISGCYGTRHVDLVISTHPDLDHVGGLETVIRGCTVGQLWMHLPWNHTDDIARMFQDGRVTDASVSEALRRSLDDARALERLAAQRNIPIVEPFAGVRDRSGNLLVLGPSKPFYESLLPGFRCTPQAKETVGGLAGLLRSLQEGVSKIAEAWDIETLTDKGDTSAENDSSTILIFGYEGDYALFTADAGMPALNGALAYLEGLGVDPKQISFVQVPHHGSRRNVGPSLLNRMIGPRLSHQVKTKTAFVSVAGDSAPKHPAKKVMNAFRRRGAEVHATAGMAKCHSKDAPVRTGWYASEPLPFFLEVEQNPDD